MKNLKTLGRALGIAALFMILAGSISGCEPHDCPEGHHYERWFATGACVRDQ
ncbi:MAG: hypothetical protein ACR2PJ_00675 [Pseudomonadales bacterium]